MLKKIIIRHIAGFVVVLFTLNMQPKFDGKKSSVTTKKMVKINKFCKCFVFSKKYFHTLLKLKH